MVEREIGMKVEDVRFKDQSFIDHMATQTPESKERHLIDQACWGDSVGGEMYSFYNEQRGLPVCCTEVFKIMLE